MSFSNDWLGIEEEKSKESPQKKVDYASALRQQQALAYRQEMLKRQQQLQLQARNIGDLVNYPIIQQQQLLQRPSNPIQPFQHPVSSQLPQTQYYNQAKLHQMQLLQQQLIQQKAANQAMARSQAFLGNIAQPTISGNHMLTSMSRPISSPPVSSPSIMSSKPVNATIDNWTKGYLNFMKNIGKEVNGLPNINGQMLNLKNFLGFVVDLGGFDKVIMENKWPLVASKLGLSSDSSENVAYLYKTLLLDFERRVFPGLSLLAQSEIRKAGANVSSRNIGNDQDQAMDGKSPRNMDSPMISNGSPAPDTFTEPSVLQKELQATEEMNTSAYMPKVRLISSFGGIDNAIFDLASSVHQNPLSSLGEYDSLILGVIDLYRVKMSLKSQLDSDCQYGIDSILAVSANQGESLRLDKYSDLIDSLFDLLMCSLRETFGACDLKPSVTSSENISYLKLYEMEMQSMNDFQRDCIPTFRDARLVLAERILAMVTTLRNFSFDVENALFLSKHELFWPVIHYLLCICLDNSSKKCSPMTLQEAGILEHRKNLVIIFSNMGSHLNIPAASSQPLMNLLEDFLSVPDSIYSYAALEALAKLSLIEDNHKCFVAASNFKRLLTLGAEFLPYESFHLNSSQEIVAQWELASLFIYNISSMDDDHGRYFIMESPNITKSIFRIVTAGMKMANQSEDYIRIITVRMLKCIRELSSNEESRNILTRYESLILGMLMGTKLMHINSEFRNEAGMILSDILKGLEAK